MSHLIFADDIVLIPKSPEELGSMLTDIHLVSKPVGLRMDLSKTNVMLNENAITSTVAVGGNTIEKVDSRPIRKTYIKMERHPHAQPGSCVSKNSQTPASVETVQGGVPPYGVK